MESPQLTPTRIRSRDDGGGVGNDDSAKHYLPALRHYFMVLTGIDIDRPRTKI